MFQLLLFNLVMHAYLIQRLLLDYLPLFVLRVKQIDPPPPLPLLLLFHHRHSEFFNLLVYLYSFISAEPCGHIRTQKVLHAQDKCQVRIIQVLFLGLLDLVHAESESFGDQLQVLLEFVLYELLEMENKLSVSFRSPLD